MIKLIFKTILNVTDCQQRVLLCLQSTFLELVRELLPFDNTTGDLRYTAVLPTLHTLLPYSQRHPADCNRTMLQCMPDSAGVKPNTRQPVNQSVQLPIEMRSISDAERIKAVALLSQC